MTEPAAGDHGEFVILTKMNVTFPAVGMIPVAVYGCHNFNVVVVVVVVVVLVKQVLLHKKFMR